MTYLDTSVVIAFVDELGPNHGKALKLLRRLRGDRVVSGLTLVELASVYSRAGLRNPLALAIYSVVCGLGRLRWILRRYLGRRLS